jgi:hypothetical protein
MAALSDTEIYRGGAVYPACLSLATRHVSVTSSDSVLIDFEIASKGGGFTRIVVALGKKDFPAIVEMISNVNRPSAIRTMVNGLQHQIVRRPKNRMRKRF